MFRLWIMYRTDKWNTAAVSGQLFSCRVGGTLPNLTAWFLYIAVSTVHCKFLEYMNAQLHTCPQHLLTKLTKCPPKCKWWGWRGFFFFLECYCSPWMFQVPSPPAWFPRLFCFILLFQTWPAFHLFKKETTWLHVFICLKSLHSTHHGNRWREWPAVNHIFCECANWLNYKKGRFWRWDVRVATEIFHVVLKAPDHLTWLNGTHRTKLQDCDWVMVRPKTDCKYPKKAGQRTGKFKRGELKDAHSRISLEEANCIPL